MIEVQTDTPPDAAEIERAMRARLEYLRPLVEEHNRLEKARASIATALANLRA